MRDIIKFSKDEICDINGTIGETHSILEAIRQMCIVPIDFTDHTIFEQVELIKMNLDEIVKKINNKNAPYMSESSPLIHLSSITIADSMSTSTKKSKSKSKSKSNSGEKKSRRKNDK